MVHDKLRLDAMEPGGAMKALVDLRHDDMSCAIRVILDDGREFAAEEVDCWWALLAIRKQLDPLGIRLLCQGSRRDVWPSGMSAQMSDGLKAYVHVLGRRGRSADLVNVFDPAPADLVGTIAEQTADRDAWASSLVARDPA